MSIEANRERIIAAPRSDQLNYEDFLGGPRDFTIERIEDGSATAPYDIYFVGEPRAWRPPVTVLRMLQRAWDTDRRADWVGRRVRLFGDDTVKIGPNRIGGVRVSHVSHIDEPVPVLLSEKRGSRKVHTVDPLPDAPAPEPAPTADAIACCTDLQQITRWGNDFPDLRDQLRERIAEIKAADEQGAES